jgi:hypothetical protein
MAENLLTWRQTTIRNSNNINLVNIFYLVIHKFWSGKKYVETWCYTVYCYSGPLLIEIRVDMSLHSDTLSWFNQSLL